MKIRNSFILLSITTLTFFASQTAYASCPNEGATCVSGSEGTEVLVCCKNEFNVCRGVCYPAGFSDPCTYGSC